MSLALEQLERAAALNHSGAINALGWHSLEIKRNLTEAAERFEKAHWLGNQDASHNLGHIWYYGRNAQKVVDRVCYSLIATCYYIGLYLLLDSLAHSLLASYVTLHYVV